MNQEQFEKHKPFAGPAKPSMNRRRIGHDYASRCIYLVTMTIEGRRPLLGTLTGNADAPDGSPDAPRIVLTPLGERVRQAWMNNEKYYKGVTVLATMVMPDHLHGILFFKEEAEVDLSTVIRGFKAGCHKAYRELGMERQPPQGGGIERQQPQQSPQGGGIERQPQQEPPQGGGTEGQPQQQPPQGGGTERQPQQEPPLGGGIEGQPQQEPPQGGGTEGQGEQPATPKKRDREHGLLWSPNYNDHILEGAGELQRWRDYLRDNPRRLAVRRAHAEYFRVRFNISVAGRTYTAIGNRELLKEPRKEQVQCSRSLTEEQIAEVVAEKLTLARKGKVLVSPDISEGEKAVMEAALKEQRSLIFLSPRGFNEYSRPGHRYYEACAEGRFLILAPWPHNNRATPLTRQMCLELNAMAKEICEEKGG